MSRFPVTGNVWDESGAITPASIGCGPGSTVLIHSGVGAFNANTAWGTANIAVFYPFAIESTVTAYQMSCMNGATVNGNIDMGIYDVNGNRLVSIGSTAMSGATTIQVFNITDTILTPGIYYMAFACSSATATFLAGTQAAQIMRVCGLQQMASAFALPATATFATYARTVHPSIAVNLKSTV